MQEDSPSPHREASHGLFVLGRNVSQCQILMGGPDQYFRTQAKPAVIGRHAPVEGVEGQFYQKIARIKTTSGNL